MALRNPVFGEVAEEARALMGMPGVKNALAQVGVSADGQVTQVNHVSQANPVPARGKAREIVAEMCKDAPDYKRHIFNCIHSIWLSSLATWA